MQLSKGEASQWHLFDALFLACHLVGSAGAAVVGESVSGSNRKRLDFPAPFLTKKRHLSPRDNLFFFFFFPRHHLKSSSFHYHPKQK